MQQFLFFVILAKKMLLHDKSIILFILVRSHTNAQKPARQL